MSGLSITICYLSIYLSIYGGVVEGGGGGPRVDGGAPTTPNQLWGGPACKSLRTPGLDQSTSLDPHTEDVCVCVCGVTSYKCSAV